MNDGREIALAAASYINATRAWSVFRSTVNFPDEADDLALRLSLERLRLEAWGKVSGLERNDFHERLFPVVELLDVILKRIKKLFLDGDQLQARYGLSDDSKAMQRLKTIVSTNDGSAGREPEDVEKLVTALQQGLRSRDDAYSVSDKNDNGSIADTASIKTNISRRFSSPKKAKWVLRDRAGFQDFITAIDGCINQLYALMSETLQQSFAEEQMRTSIALVGKAETRPLLSLARRASMLATQDQVLFRMLERKGISDALEFNDFSESTLTHRRQTSKGLINLSATDFYMPESTSSRRFLTSSRTWQGSIVLLERKEYPDTADPSDLEKLDARIQRLALLLSNSNSELDALKCLGYFLDAKHSCWWLAFEFPHRQKHTSNSELPTRLTSSTRPVSLLRLLCYRTSRWKPSLASRLRLANQLATTLSALFSGGWMHRGLRSANILFPYMYHRKDGKPNLEGFDDISKPLLSGFEYSQHAQDSWDGIIYRHPKYTESILAAESKTRPAPYRPHYDIYSFGLILVEIALWMPLLDFLDANAADFLEEGTEEEQPAQTSRQLSRKMDLFTPDDGRELQKRVQRMVRKELAFCMGTRYRDAVRWCLQYPDTARGEAQDEPWMSALDFYDKVVVPLSHLASVADA